VTTTDLGPWDTPLRPAVYDQAELRPWLAQRKAAFGNDVAKLARRLEATAHELETATADPLFLARLADSDLARFRHGLLQRVERLASAALAASIKLHGEEG
jgi:hypothetical protein